MATLSPLPIDPTSAMGTWLYWPAKPIGDGEPGINQKAEVQMNTPQQSPEWPVRLASWRVTCEVKLTGEVAKRCPDWPRSTMWSC